MESTISSRTLKIPRKLIWFSYKSFQVTDPNQQHFTMQSRSVTFIIPLWLLFYHKFNPPFLAPTIPLCHSNPNSLKPTTSPVSPTTPLVPLFPGSPLKWTKISCLVVVKRRWKTRKIWQGHHNNRSHARKLIQLTSSPFLPIWPAIPLKPFSPCFILKQ